MNDKTVPDSIDTDRLAEASNQHVFRLWGGLGTGLMEVECEAPDCSWKAIFNPPISAEMKSQAIRPQTRPSPSSTSTPRSAYGKDSSNMKHQGPTDIGRIVGDDEDLDALAESWHHIAAGAEWLDDDGVGARSAAVRLLEDAAAVLGIPHHLIESERIRVIADHAENAPGLTAETGSTGVPEPEKHAQASDWPDEGTRANG